MKKRLINFLINHQIKFLNMESGEKVKNILEVYAQLIKIKRIKLFILYTEFLKTKSLKYIL